MIVLHRKSQTSGTSVPLEGFEPPTRSLGRSGSSTELQRQGVFEFSRPGRARASDHATRRKSLVASAAVLAVTAAMATKPATVAAVAPSVEASVVR